ncbi:D-methionine transport system permease protein [Paenibacillus sp. V4I3]|uniref:methionine ABC transporter permease n=1 Tax=unclassified Paenibacillus TaxID=185978 RepID=UPI00277DCAFE|nr:MULTISPECIES: methionine ABC transporter permease [unclassified Paenibacillus]MDQ0877695.1 D-methionine transport system permease protein [Paenibacillus sp. V4I3]MDQ0886430.1 D-methionine transport system permease protein [Paenibacillus sp. V4I9]MDQ0901226.1 D-methionine transport system permease protein [Paenibacillus sp. V4I7]MDQ0920277.1 D-methionine transport system permease protein [Paenibacillus sp. V4I5]
MLNKLIEDADLYLKSINETAVMVGYSLVISSVIGLLLGVLLVVLRPGNLYANSGVYHILNAVINIIRSIPFIIIMVAIIPLTKWLVGTTIGVKGAIVPLVFYTAPYISRLMETALLEVDPGIIEAYQAMGASKQQIIFRVILREARPALILGLAIATIGLIGASAMAGVMGAGGLGDVAIRFGYQRWEPDVMYTSVLLLVLIVQIVQSLGNWISKRLRK